MTAVKELVETHMGSNAYTVARHLELTAIPHRTIVFPTTEEAEDFIIEKHMSMAPSELANLLHNAFPEVTENKERNDKIEEFKRQFCFDDDKYIVYRRFFLHDIT